MGKLGERKDCGRMKAFKWNFKQHKYFDYDLPEGCRLITPRLEDIVSCVECGYKLQYGDCYASMKIHDENGFGYPVCEKCYDKEVKERECSGK